MHGRIYFDLHVLPSFDRKLVVIVLLNVHAYFNIGIVAKMWHVSHVASIFTGIPFCLVFS